MTRVKHIAIIGGGFCGSLTAVHLIRNAKGPLKITLINSGAPFVRGIAYNAYSSKHLLNVSAGNMSAFPEDTEHFTNWLLTKDTYSGYEKDLLEKTFIPRNLYGDYLCGIWEATVKTKKENIELYIKDDYAIDIEFTENKSAKVILKKGEFMHADYIVLTTGNSLPRNPSISNIGYYSSPTYYRNPWNIDSVNNLNPTGDVLIIGNGLTMADTVIGLREHGFKNKIYSISRNGYGLLPHRHLGVKYNGLEKDIQRTPNLDSLFHIVISHIKKVRELGISAGPVIDSLRPYSQQIWQSFTLPEKKQFLSRFRYMWAVARHRLPVLIYDHIEKLRIAGQLEIYRGTLTDIIEKENKVFATFYNSKKQCDETIAVQRVINCTGPETGIHKTLNPLLNNLATRNIISPDPLKLGIDTNISTYQTLTPDGKKKSSIFTIGNNLKGLLWETIAIPELRIQCQQLARILLQHSEDTENLV